MTKSKLLLACTAIVLATCSAPKPDVLARQKSLRAIADDYWAFFLRESPESATSLGENKYNGKLSDFSLAHVEASRKDAAALLDRVKAIDPAGLPAADLLDHPLLTQTLSDQLESVRLKNYEMPLDQLHGAHLIFPQLSTVAPFATVEDYRNYIARLNAIPTAIDQIIELSRAGLKDGLIQPRFF